MIEIQEIGEQDITAWLLIFNNEIIPQYHSVLEHEIKNIVADRMTEKDISESIANGYKYYFIYSEKDIVGTTYRKPKEVGVTAYINGFYIMPSKQHSGLGTKAFTILLDIIKEYGYTYIYRETRKEYYRATSFYEKMGYEKIDTNDILRGHYLGKYYNRLAENTILYAV